MTVRDRHGLAELLPDGSARVTLRSGFVTVWTLKAGEPHCLNGVVDVRARAERLARRALEVGGR